MVSIGFYLSKNKGFWLRTYSILFHNAPSVTFESYLRVCHVSKAAACVHKAKSVCDYVTHLYVKYLQTTQMFLIQLCKVVLTLFPLFLQVLRIDQ